MISIKENSLQIRGREKPITSWVVWWLTPVGVTAHRDVAVDLCEKAGIDPELLTPVPVALAEDDYEIFFPRR